MVTMMDFQAARWLMEGDVPGQAGNDHPTSMPTSVYPTADGFVNIAAAGTAIYTRFCEALGMPELAVHPDYASADARSKNRVALSEAIAARTRNYTSDALIALLNKAGVPSGPIYKMDRVFADPQVQHLGMAVAVPTPDGGEARLVGPAMRALAHPGTDEAHDRTGRRAQRPGAARSGLYRGADRRAAHGESDLRSVA